MAQDWFELSLTNGGLKRAKAPGSPTPMHWVERDIENLLTLNPDFLDVADHVPLRQRGVRGTVTSPDQAFADELGRIVVVEVKKIRASLPVIAQVIAYASHWQTLPSGEINRGLGLMADPIHRVEIFGCALSEVITWATGQDHRIQGGATAKKLGTSALSRLDPVWARGPSPTICKFADNYSNPGRLPCIGATPRLIAVAPGFSDEEIDFADDLAKRMVAIELVEIEVVRERGTVYVGRRFVHRDPDSEPTWRFLRRAWQEVPHLQETFAVNGWADTLNRESFSLSARQAPDARLWISASDRNACITTAVPDGWYAHSAAERRLLRRRFLDALPEDVDGRWLEWEFKYPTEDARAIQCIRRVSEAILKVLVPADTSAMASL